MGFRKFLARLNNSRKGATESTDPAVPPRPQSQPGIRPSESTLPILQRRKPDSESTQFSPSSQFDLGATGGATPNIPSVSGHHLPGPNADESKPVGLSSYIIDPTAAYENKPDWKSTLHASAGLVIDVVKESSDVFTPLKSVAGGLCAILKHYDVRYPYFTKHFTPLTFELASDGEPSINRIVNTPGRRPCRITKHSRSRGRDQGNREEADTQTVSR